MAESKITDQNDIDENLDDDEDDVNGKAGEKNTDDNSDEKAKGNKDGDDDEKDDTKSLTQKELNKMMAREKRQGKRSVLNELGIDPKDKDSIEKVKQFIESQKSEEQHSSEAQQKLAEYEKRAKTAEIKSQLMIMGAKPEFIDDISVLVEVRLAKVEDDDYDDELKDIVEEYKKKTPIWFTLDDDNNTGNKGTGSNPKLSGSNNKGKNNSSIGSRLAAQRVKSNKVKESYWK